MRGKGRRATTSQGAASGASGAGSTWEGAGREGGREWEDEAPLEEGRSGSSVSSPMGGGAPPSVKEAGRRRRWVVGRVGGVQLGPGFTWEGNVVCVIKDTNEFPRAVIPREAWVAGVCDLGGVKAQSW